MSSCSSAVPQHTGPTLPGQRRQLRSCISPVRASRSARKFAALKLTPAPPRGTEMSAEILQWPLLAEHVGGHRQSRESRGRWLHAPGTRQFPLVSHRSCCSYEECLWPRAGRLLTGESCLKPWAAASIIFPVSNQVGVDQKEMVNLRRRLLKHLCPQPFGTHFAPGNCWAMWIPVWP